MLRLALLIVAAASAQEAPPIVNGSSTADWPAVGQLMACSSSCFMFCSATLVDPEWVITAAHCVDALAGYRGYDLYFAVGPKQGEISDYQLIRDWASHPEYDPYSLNHDIGIVELEAPLTTVEPMPVNEDKVSQSWVGSELTYVGYGVTDDDRSDSGTKRYAEMPISGYDSATIYALDTRDGQNICFGDSGGAALEPVEGGWELAGVNSYVYSHSNPYKMCDGGGNGVARVDSHLSWIRGFVDVGGFVPEEEQPEEEEQPDQGSQPPEEEGPDQGEPGGEMSVDVDRIEVPQGGEAEARMRVRDGAQGAGASFLLVQDPEQGEAAVDAQGRVVYRADEEALGYDRLYVLVTGQGGQELEVEVRVEVLAWEEMSPGGRCASAPGGPAGALALLGLGLLRRRTRRSS